MFFKENDLSMSGAEYIRFLYQSTKNGKLTVACEEDDAVTYPVDWDERVSEALVQQFETLEEQLRKLGKQHETLMESTEGLSGELLEVWSTYIAPFPDHGMDKDQLFEIQMKEEYEALTEEEFALLEEYWQWYEQQCLQRLPYNRCSPAELINRARRYEKLVSLGAPKIILNNEAFRLAEELVLYYCMKK